MNYDPTNHANQLLYGKNADAVKALLTPKTSNLGELGMLDTMIAEVNKIREKRVIKNRKQRRAEQV